MNVKELRIGNYIRPFKPKKKHDLIKINGEQIDAIELTSYEMIDLLYDYPAEGDHIQGIPITNEWLLKFGFEKMKYPYLDYDMNECDLFESDWGNFYQIENFYLPTPYYFSAAFGENFKLKHVHQLQNLCHSLTGTELKINL